MGSVRLPNLSLNGNFLYFKNIFNKDRNFWHYYYFFFYANTVIKTIFKDDFLVKFSKLSFFNNDFKVVNFQKNTFYLGFIHLFKIQKWSVINLFLYNLDVINVKTSNTIYFDQKTINLNLLVLKKKKLNYKNLIK